MAYTRTTWVNNNTPAINAGNLNKIEDGIFEAHQDLTNFDSRLTTAESDIATLTTSVSDLEALNISTRLDTLEVDEGWSMTTSDYTASAGDNIFVDTRSNVVNIEMPESPSMGDSVRVVDVAGYFGTTQCNVNQNSVSGENIMGVADNIILSSNNQVVQLVYSGDATLGWRIVART